MADRSLIDIAAELYATSPESFIASRNRLAESADDATLGAQIRALRKPSTAAWVVNLFARERSDRLADALRLADELRQAQAELDAQTLAQLGRQRRALTSRLAEEAATLAIARGGRVTAATREAVQQTITAAFFDPHAAEAVASGRLVRELEASGEATLDLRTAVAGGAPEGRELPQPPADELRARRERRSAERELHDAEQALARAQREQTSAARERRESAERADALTDRIRELEDELSRVRKRAEAARREVDELDGRIANLDENVRGAENAVTAATSKLRELGRP
ncbi:transposase [Microbacterium sp.]|uniref:transposase n=1 Tax=Microbacterium sp. TaxID=51671 RepID=UPI0028125E4C|nr:transposase [Microbacterium sp.]